MSGGAAAVTAFGDDGSGDPWGRTTVCRLGVRPGVLTVRHRCPLAVPHAARWRNVPSVGVNPKRRDDADRICWMGAVPRTHCVFVAEHRATGAPCRKSLPLRVCTTARLVVLFLFDDPRMAWARFRQRRWRR